MNLADEVLMIVEWLIIAWVMIEMALVEFEITTAKVFSEWVWLTETLKQTRTSVAN